jgi:hydrogenase maturation protein HypF
VVSKDDSQERLQVRILGVVQGVGFRPFVYRLAIELGLKGWVRNDGQGVTIEAEGPQPALIEFLRRLPLERPAPSYIYALDYRFLASAGYSEFQIAKSESQGSVLVWVLPDLATCGECRRELLDPSNRRYRYPFINCTHCGTRFTIIEQLPYDRPLTSMKSFTMCDECRWEYEDPMDRRFHAQPNACAACGPHLEYQAVNNGAKFVGEEALREAEQGIRDGKILAVKGIGGYHLILDAGNEDAVAELRKRKRRQNKAFAVMYPEFESLKRHVHVPDFARGFLTSTQAPILILQRTPAGWSDIAPSVAPRSPYLGVFLPYSPLHILLLNDLQFPVIATSGNLSDDPIQYGDAEARASLGRLCDGFLTHNRPIVHHADDSVLQIVTRPEVKPQMLRRARGYTPLPILAPRSLPPLLALGGHLNATFALSRDREIIVSQHLGDLDGFESRLVFEQTLRDFQKLYDLKPETVAHDLHPDYYTTRLAAQLGLPAIAVQHHHAHLAACMLENQIEGPVLGLTWDGTGYGPDKTVWGGEFLLGTPRDFKRVASLRPFLLPAGEKGIKETWRTALSLLQEAFGKEIPRDLPLFEAIPEKSVEMTLQILQKRILSPVTTSMGRLFDGVSAILGVSLFNTHQAESAQMLEYAAWKHNAEPEALPLPVVQEDILRLDWRELVRAIVERKRKGTPVEALAAAFHRSLAEAAVIVTNKLEERRIVMAGGVFCNRYLTEALLSRYSAEGIHAFIHSQIPPTDGSLSVGQLWVAAHQL